MALPRVVSASKVCHGVTGQVIIGNLGLIIPCVTAQLRLSRGSLPAPWESQKSEDIRNPAQPQPLLCPKREQPLAARSEAEGELRTGPLGKTLWIHISLPILQCQLPLSPVQYSRFMQPDFFDPNQLPKASKTLCLWSL